MMAAEESAHATLDDEIGSGIYLKLVKGDKVRVRWIGGLIRFEQWFDGRDAEPGEWADKWAIALIHRDKDTKTNMVRGFKFGPMIYRAFQTLWRNDEWGDLSGYDVVIDVPGVSPSYYTVTPCRPVPLTEDEKTLVLENPLDLEAMYFSDNTRLVGEKKQPGQNAQARQIEQGAEADAAVVEASEGEYDPFAND